MYVCRKVILGTHHHRELMSAAKLHKGASNYHNHVLSISSPKTPCMELKYMYMYVLLQSELRLGDYY